jgi:hypothetical protein
MNAQRFAVNACVTGLGAGAVLGRSKLLRWGATADEVREALPGDNLVRDPHLTATRAITIHRTAAEVWPWIAQLGQGRGGFYSYDRLENLIGCDIHSADRVVAAWQEVRVGHEVRLAPEVALAVALADAPLALVLRGGVPMGVHPPPYDFSWAFVLHEEPPGVTRLVVRERYRYLRAWARLIVEPVAVVSFVMTQRMLLGIRDRAEATEAIAAPYFSHAPPSQSRPVHAARR